MSKLQKIIDEVCTEMCDNYCKFPAEYGDTDEGFGKMMDERCANCPLCRIS